MLLKNLWYRLSWHGWLLEWFYFYPVCKLIYNEKTKQSVINNSLNPAAEWSLKVFHWNLPIVAKSIFSLFVDLAQFIFFCAFSEEKLFAMVVTSQNFVNVVVLCVVLRSNQRRHHKNVSKEWLRLICFDSNLVSSDIQLYCCIY